jgi:acyl dehydratase
MPRSLYLDDVTVGDSYTTDTVTVSADDIITFATSFDPQPFHTDPVAAESTFFHGLAASGWHTASISMRLLVTSGLLADGVIGAGAELAWPTPTRPDDVLRVRSTVAGITPSRSRPDRGVVELVCETLTENDEVRQRMTARLVVFRRPAAAG